MSPVYFRGQNAVCEAPPNHDPRTCPLGEIVGLPVLFLTDARGNHLGFRSVWRPSPEEIAGIVAGGGIMVMSWPRGSRRYHSGFATPPTCWWRRRMKEAHTVTQAMLDAACAVIQESGMLPWGELTESHSVAIEEAIKAALAAQEVEIRSNDGITPAMVQAGVAVLREWLDEDRLMTRDPDLVRAILDVTIVGPMRAVGIVGDDGPELVVALQDPA